MSVLSNLYNIFPYFAKIIGEHILTSGMIVFINKESTILLYIIGSVLWRFSQIGDSNIDGDSKIALVNSSTERLCSPILFSILNWLVRYKLLFGAICVRESIREIAILGLYFSKNWNK